MSGEGGEEEDNNGENKDNAGVGAGANNSLRPTSLELLQASTLCPTIVTEYGDCNGRTQTYEPNLNTDLKDDSPEDELDDDVSNEE